MLRPLSRPRARVCKLDWTDYEHDGMRQLQEGRGKGEELKGAVGWWWDDTGCSGEWYREEHDTLGAIFSWSSCARQLLCWIALLLLLSRVFWWALKFFDLPTRRKRSVFPRRYRRDHREWESL